jgi:hypothetical protein
MLARLNSRRKLSKIHKLRQNALPLYLARLVAPKSNPRGLT